MVASLTNIRTVYFFTFLCFKAIASASVIPAVIVLYSTTTIFQQCFHFPISLLFVLYYRFFFNENTYSAISQNIWPTSLVSFIVRLDFLFLNNLHSIFSGGDLRNSINLSYSGQSQFYLLT